TLRNLAATFGSGPAVGCGELKGDNLAVSVGPTGAAYNAPTLAGYVMHELGHTLNLNHGGGDTDDYKPNYQSVMSNGLIDFAYNEGRPLDYSRQKNADLNECSLNENNPFPTLDQGRHATAAFHNGAP